jgi:predicted amidohydrolase YtcJ
MAVREVLDILSELPSAEQEGNETMTQGSSELASSPHTSSLPHRIEHVQLIHPADLPRLNRHGIVASVQPVHLVTDWPTADKVWGKRARYAYAFRSLLDHGTWLAMGSDAPVAPLNPMLGIFAAVARQDERGEPASGWYPEEKISIAEAVHGYTMGPAYMAGKQHVQGSITPGKWADMIVLSHNLFEIPPTEIPQTTVDLTVFDGQVVFQRE